MSNEKEGSLQIVENFASNVGLVLSKVKDTIVKDFLDGLSQDNMSWEMFREKVASDPREGLGLIEQFINEIIKKLGYDISNCKSNEIINLFKSLVNSSFKLQETVSQLVEQCSNIDWNSVVDNYVDSDNSNEQTSTAKALFEDISSGKIKSKQGDVASLDIVIDLFNQIKDIVALIKKFSNIEWKNIANDADGFGKFLKESYFTEEFGKRILDYVLVLLLKKSQEVFRDDVKNLIKNVKESGKNLVEGFCAAGVTKEDLIRCQEEIEAVEALIEEEREVYYENFMSLNIDIEFEPTAYLQVRLDEANDRLDALLSKGKIGYNKIARIFKQTYCILDLMGLIEQKEIRLASFIPNEKISDALGTSINITTLRWNLITKIFTDPLNYLKTVFDIDSIEDAQKLLTKIIAVIKAFKSDTFNFDSSSNLVYSLLIKSNGHEQIKNLLDVQNKINVALKEKIKTQVDQYNEGDRENCRLFDVMDEVYNEWNTLNYEDENSNNTDEQIRVHIRESIIPILGKAYENCCDTTNNEKLKDLEKIANGFENVVLDIYKSQSNQLADSIENNWHEVFYNSMDSIADASEYLFRECEYKFDKTKIDGEDAGIIEETITVEGFTVDGFLGTIKQKFINILSTDIDSHYKSVMTSVEGLTMTVIGGDSDSKKIASDIMAELWGVLKSDVNNYVNAPFSTCVGKALNELRKNLFQDLQIDLSNVNQSKLPDAIYDLSKWSDGISSIKEIINAVSGIKGLEELTKSLPSLPDIGLKNLNLPEGTFDAKNNMVSVSLCNLSNGDSKLKVQLIAFVGTKEIDKKEKKGLFIVPVLSGNTGAQFNIGKNHKITLNANFAINEANSDSTKKIGLFIYSKKKLNLGLETVKDGSVKFDAIAEFRRKNDDEKNDLEIFNTDIAELSLKNYPLSVFFEYNDSSYDVGVKGAIEDLKLLLKLRNQNEFFKKVLHKDIEINLESLSLEYTIKKGFSIGGSFYVEIPLANEISYKGLKFSNICVELGGKDGDLVANVCTSFTANINGFAISFTDLGIGCTCNILDSNGKLGDLNFQPEYKYPTGLGIAIDTSCVKGSGAINWDKENGRFFGEGSLEILEKISVGGFFLFTTEPFSFVGALYCTFTPGIQLGMGFSLNGIGGSLGINRSLSVDKLRTAVYDGSLSTVLFVKDIAKNFDKIISNVSNYYPIAQDQFFFGFLAQLKWGELLSADLGLFIQGPDFKLIIAGELSFSVAEEADKLLSINVSFIGGIELSKGLFFDASIHDSKLVGLELKGDIALRIYWAGNTKGFILTAGGFHPQYKPESGFDLPTEMKRLSISLKCSCVKMVLEAYLAVTSNTVQFGARFDLKAEACGCGITGYLEFNALFQFKPFHFVVDMSAGVSVKVFGINLMSIALSFSLSGPTPWNVKGNAHINVLWFTVSPSFNVTWGKKQGKTIREHVNIYEIFKHEWETSENWATISSDDADNLVQLLSHETKEKIVYPSDLISFNQSAVPLNKDMSIYGEKIIEDINKIEIESISIGESTKDNDSDSEYKFETASFAPSLIEELSEDKKLSSPSYVDMESGFKFGSNFGVKNSNSKIVSQTREDKYETNITDVNIEEWNNLYDSLPGAKSTTSKTETSDIKAGSYSSEIKLNNKFVTRRASARRESSGFDQYVKNLDQCIIESLNSKKK